MGAKLSLGFRFALGACSHRPGRHGRVYFMDPRKTSLERAFDMAKTRPYADLAALMRDLKQEGYDQRQIEGPQLKKQLSELIRSTRANDATRS